MYIRITTSAAVDAYCVGLPVTIYIDGLSLNLSPLKVTGCFYVSKPEELAKSFNSDYQRRNSYQARKDFFYLDEDLSMWLKVLSCDK